MPSANATVNATVNAATKPATLHVNLGIAGQFNAFVFSNFTSYSSDTEGPLAVGGNVDVQNYSINDVYASNSRVAVIVGRDVNFDAGSFIGQIDYSGSASVTRIDLKDVSQHSPTAAIDFSAEKNVLGTLSSQLSAAPANGKAVFLYGGVQFIGDGTNNPQVFDVTAAQMANVTYGSFSNLSPGQTVIVNISGDSVSFLGGWTNGMTIYNALYNLSSATNITIDTNVYGSILAPNATVNGGQGVINGNVIVHAWNSGIQINSNDYFQAVTIPVNGITAPTVVITTHSGVVQNGGVTNDVSPVMSGTGVVGHRVTVKDGTTVLGTSVVANNGTWALTLNTPLINGLQAISVTQADKNGNVSPAINVSFTVDTIAYGAPTVVITNPSQHGVLTAASIGPSGMPGAGHINLLISLPGNASAGDILTMVDQAGNQVTQGLTAAHITVGVVTLLGNFLAPAPGTNFKVVATLTDSAGNVSHPGSTSALIQNVIPGAPSVTVSTPSGTVAQGSRTTLATPTISGSGIAGNIVVVKDRNTVLGSVFVDINGNWKLPLIKPLANGIQAISVTQTDAYGNTSVAAITNFTVDTVTENAPTVAITNLSQNGVLTTAHMAPNNAINLQKWLDKMRYAQMVTSVAFPVLAPLRRVE